MDNHESTTVLILFCCSYFKIVLWTTILIHFASNLKEKEDLSSSILEYKIMAYSLSIWINSPTQEMCHGSNLFGMLTTLIEKSLMQ
jgi:hypothetical protein